MDENTKYELINDAINIISRCSDGYYVAYRVGNGDVLQRSVCNGDVLVNQAYDIVGVALEMIFTEAEERGIDKKELAKEIMDRALNAEPFEEDDD